MQVVVASKVGQLVHTRSSSKPIATVI